MTNMRRAIYPPDQAKQDRQCKNSPDDPTASHEPILPPPPALKRTIEFSVVSGQKVVDGSQ